MPRSITIETELDPARLPKHVAVIMDGNGRWAQKRGLPRSLGHRAGMEAMRGIIRHTDDLGISVLSLYAFSTENWRRPRDEVGFLMDLLIEYLKRDLAELHEKNVHIRMLGELDEPLPVPVRRAIEGALVMTEHNDGLVLNLALNYGGRLELVRAAQRLAEKVKAGALAPEEIDEAALSAELYTGGIAHPDPDLVIRTSGEQRLSNFLLYQLAYAEFAFPEELFPDYDVAAYERDLRRYAGRERRFGGVGSGGGTAGQRPK